MNVYECNGENIFMLRKMKLDQGYSTIYLVVLNAIFTFLKFYHKMQLPCNGKNFCTISLHDHEIGNLFYIT